MKRTLLWTLTVVSVMLIGIAAVPLSAVAGPMSLPPRPTPVPTATTVPQANPMTGSAIQLQVATALTHLWTVVEWQDAADNWHPVEGWQGMFESDHTKTWWVAEGDRGKGPFRWVIYTQPGGPRWGSSESFYLPTAQRQILQVKVTATP